LTNNDPKSIRELAGLYLTRTQEQFVKLREAIGSQSAVEVGRLAHTCAGSSGACGMNTIVEPLKEIEARAAQGQWSGVERLFQTASAQLIRIQEYLERHLPV
jgi:HPt (histidine-containing phosphotransfer) domain-containing protein